MTALPASLLGRQVLLLNWRDPRHPAAGGAERYAFEIARRWATAGLGVTWLTSRPAGLPAREVLDGVTVLRAGGEFSLYARAALRIARSAHRFDAIVDCQNGIPFFAPLFAGRTPTVQVVHHVHQDQFALRFGKVGAAVGRWLEADLSRAVYRHATVAVSPSTRQELRRRLGIRGDVYVVPNGSEPGPRLSGPRDPDPTITVVSRLVPHKRVDRLIEAVPAVLERFPALRVHVVGDGPELPHLSRLVSRLDLDPVVTLHGRQPDHVRDDLLASSWLTVMASHGEGWGISVIEAARFGVPCVGFAVPGVRDSVLDGTTGWLQPEDEPLDRNIIRALEQLSDDRRAAQIVDACRRWADSFSWDRSAERLAGVVADEIQRRTPSGRAVRRARSELGTVVRFRGPLQLAASFRPSDETSVDDAGVITALLHGCDEMDAATLVEARGGRVLSIRLAGDLDLLAGPGARPRTTTDAEQ
ncbi:glycosyltransferase family 4 protein [Modestobacter versicolor]|uniref:glycosyltransferase family 4 protein n=1 Tax=Modestobacter versicolor TaxID=429133 RepID=UPI0034DFB90E